MSFSTIAASDVDADSPITDTLMSTIRTNFDDHESRIGVNTQSGAVTLMMDAVTVGTVDTWEKMAEFSVWIPPDIQKLKAKFRGGSYATSNKMRLEINASSTVGPEVQATVSGDVLEDYDLEISPAAGDKGAWGVIELWHRRAGGGGSSQVHKSMETIDGVLRDYSSASYWE